MQFEIYIYATFSHVTNSWKLQNCPQEKIFDTRNILDKKFWTHEIPTKAKQHDGTRHTRPTMACDPRNLAHSKNDLNWKIIWKTGKIFYWPGNTALLDMF